MSHTHIKSPYRKQKINSTWSQFLEAKGQDNNHKPKSEDMKTPAQMHFRRLIPLFVIAGLALFSLANAFAQKADSLSPNEPKVSICHNGFTITVGESAVPAHLAHGDTFGGCPGEGSYVICHNGSTITVKESALPNHLAHGDTLGPCSSFAGGAAKIAPMPVKIAPLAVGAPVAVGPAKIATPVVQEDLVICYKGQNVMITPASLQTYLSIGAKLGRCSEQPKAAEPIAGQK